MERNSFIFHSMWWDLLKELPDDDRGRLLKAICAYVFEGEIPSLEPMEMAIFSMIRKKLDDDYEEWMASKKRMAEGGKKGMESRWGKGSIRSDKGVISSNKVVKAPITPITVTVTDTVTDTVTVTDTATDTVTEKKEKEHKSAYGEFKHVRLTDPEYQKLCQDYGDMETHNAIKYLDEYIEEKGYKSKSHNLAIRRWVFDAVKERQRKKPQEQNKGVDAWAEALKRVEERRGAQ